MNQFFDEIFKFFTETIWEWLQALIKWAFELLEVWFYEAATKVLLLLAGYVENFLDFDGQTTALQNAFGGLPSDVIAIVTLMQIQPALVILFAAYASRALLSLLMKAF